jgi:hypothetical protein
MMGSIVLRNCLFVDFCATQLSRGQILNAFCLAEIIGIREGYVTLLSGGDASNFSFTHSEIDDILESTACMQ